MAEPLADQIIRKVKQVAELYHRLILVVAPAGAGKTSALQEVRNRTGPPLVNVNLELSRRMLELTESQRALHLPRLLQEIVSNCGDSLKKVICNPWSYMTLSAVFYAPGVVRIKAV